jgi:hypothetical protein
LLINSRVPECLILVMIKNDVAMNAFSVHLAGMPGNTSVRSTHLPQVGWSVHFPRGGRPGRIGFLAEFLPHHLIVTLRVITFVEKKDTGSLKPHPAFYLFRLRAAFQRLYSPPLIFALPCTVVYSRLPCL